MSQLTDQQNAIEMLRTEHEQMRELLRIIASEEDLDLAHQLLEELNGIVKIHSQLEQKLFYPFVAHHIRWQIMNQTAAEFNSVEKLLSAVECSDHQELSQSLAHVGERLEKHIFDAEELLFMKMEQSSSDVTYSLSPLSAKMHAKKKELLRQLGLPKAS